jgi:hypothetical protein
MESEKTGMTLDDLDRPRLTESTVILYRLVGDTTT